MYTSNRLDTDLFSNTTTGQGIVGRDVFASTAINTDPLAGWLSYNEAYALLKDAIINRFICAVPKAASAKGWEILEEGKTISKQDKRKKSLTQIANDYHLFKKHSIADYFRDAQIEANVGDGHRGGACLVLNIDDGRSPDQPVDVENIKSILSMNLFTVDMIMPDPMYGDKKRAFIVRTVYDYTHYRITDQYYLQNLISITSGGKNGTYDQYARIHEDRIIRFDGVKLTSRMMVEQYEGWGMSKLPTIIKDYKRYDTCLTAVAQIVQTSSTMIHKIKGLTETLASKDEEAVLQLAQSLRDVKMLMNVWGGAVVDMENADLNYLSRQFNGLDAIVDKLRESFTAASGISHDQLFGQTPNGWGDSGESEEKKWQKEIEMFQTSEWLSKLKKLYTYVFAAKDCQAQVKDGWEIEFFPLRQVTEKEEIEMRSSQAIIDSTYQAMGAVSIQEIRDSRLRPAKFSAQTILDDAVYKKEQEAAAQQAIPPEGEALPPEDDLGYDSTFDG